MKLSQHPEYRLYVTHQTTAQKYEQAVAAWEMSTEPVVAPNGFRWTYAQAQELVQSLSRLFQAYNRVLWRQFPYCSRCGGGCCVVDASDVKPMDYVALALLGESLPERPLQIEITSRACIYLQGTSCSWPTTWRPLKCAAFYCLGSGDWALDSRDTRYGEVTVALQQVVRDHLPDSLTQNKVTDDLAAFLSDPIGFAQALSDLLDDILVMPLLARFGIDENGGRFSSPPTPDVFTDALTFISEATEQIWESTQSASDQLLDDLALLEWIILGRPQQAAKLLAELAERYTPPFQTGAPTSIQDRFHQHTLLLLKHLTDEQHNG